MSVVSVGWSIWNASKGFQAIAGQWTSKMQGRRLNCTNRCTDKQTQRERAVAGRYVRRQYTHHDRRARQRMHSDMYVDRRRHKHATVTPPAHTPTRRPSSCLHAPMCPGLSTAAGDSPWPRIPHLPRALQSASRPGEALLPCAVQLPHRCAKTSLAAALASAATDNRTRT